MAQLSFEELKALLTLNRFVSSRKILRLLEEGTGLLSMLERIEHENLTRFNAEAEIERCEKLGIRLLTWFDSDYPSSLRVVVDPPVLLYQKGYFEEADEAAVAVVGTRHPSFYGRTQAEVFSRGLAEAGLTIVSGLAKGIDKASHEAALGVRHGRTLAVLGSGLDVIYPREHRELYEKIAERGAVVSEYALGTPPHHDNFPRRNRIISGLALATLVIEAHSRSGSLITAHEAIDQGRDVFAVPGPVDQLTSRGTHRLLKEGAYLAEGPLDILEVLRPQLWPLTQMKAEPELASSPRSQETSLKPSVLSLNEDEEALVRLLSESPLSSEDMAHRTRFAAAKLASTLLGLELKQKVRKSPDGTFTLRAG